MPEVQLFESLDLVAGGLFLKRAPFVLRVDIQSAPLGAFFGSHYFNDILIEVNP